MMAKGESRMAAGRTGSPGWRTLDSRAKQECAALAGCGWASGGIGAASAWPRKAKLDFERSRDCEATKPLWSETHSRSYGLSEEQVQACLDEPGP